MLLKKKPRKKRKRNKALNLMRFFIEVILLMALSVVLFLSYKYYRMKHISLSDSDTVICSSLLEEEEGQESVRKIFMILPLDDKELDDILMLASVKEEDGKICVISIDSDSVLYQEDGTVTSCRELYADAGAQALMSMLNQAMDLDCTDYFTVKSEALVKMTDFFGGVEISLAEGEADSFSEYLSYNGEGGDFGPGIQLLTGRQALLYCREAKADWSADTLERLSQVTGQIWKKASRRDIRELNEISDQFMYDVTTSISFVEFLSLLKNIGRYQIVSSSSLPYKIYGIESEVHERMLNK